MKGPSLSRSSPWGGGGGVSNDWCINPLFKFMTNETPICFSITSNAKTKNEIQIRFSKWCENEKRKLKFISVFQSEAKTKNKICFLMSCGNKKCKWHLNSIFPCHRKTVGTKVHAFKRTLYVIRIIQFEFINAIYLCNFVIIVYLYVIRIILYIVIDTCPYYLPQLAPLFCR